jgi:hypothetical protein
MKKLLVFFRENVVANSNKEVNFSEYLVNYRVENGYCCSQIERRLAHRLLKGVLTLIALCVITGSANAQAVKVNSNGNVGFGTSNPGWAMHLKKSVNGEIAFVIENTYGGSARTYLIAKPGKSMISATHDFSIETFSSGTWSDKFVIKNNGNIGIGTTNPQTKLDVAGNAYFSNASIGRSGSHYDEFGYNVGFAIYNDRYTYRTDDPAASIRMGVNGSIAFRTAPYGTAGANLTLTERMRITQEGNVGIGTGTANPICKLQVVDGYNDYAFSNTGGINFGASINGENPTRLDFWHPVSQWNNVRFKGYSLSSDSTLKTDIRTITNATDILKQIKTYSYYFKSDRADTRQRDYGVLAQDLENVLPELIDTAKGNMFVNYNAFFAILIKGFNEQQIVIESLQTQIDSLQQESVILSNALIACCNSGSNKKSIQSFELTDPTATDELKVFQNVPNPFNENTMITCYIPENIKKAELCVYDMLGSLLKCFVVSERGTTSVQIQAGQLASGVYTYLLIGDGKASEAKQMILTK